MADLKNKSIEDLKKEVLEKREALRSFRFEGAGGRTRNVREGRAVRRDIARLLTEIRSRRLASGKQSA